jgi:cation transport regulator
MYYANIQSLPQTLRETLPPEAQAVYLETYNRIWEQYATTTRDAAMLPTIAHQQAWDEMSRQFTFIKRDDKGQWVRKGEESTLDKPKERAEKKGFFARLGFARA